MIDLKNSLLLTLLCLPVVNHADCDKRLDILLNQRHHSQNSNMAICKVWMTYESKSIVVLPLPQGDGMDDTYKLDVLVNQVKSLLIVGNQMHLKVIPKN